MKTQYLSEEGYENLKKELRHLKIHERKKIANDIAEARAKGDLSENAEYDAAKEAQGKLEDKITRLENTLAHARILDESKVDTSKVYLLSTVTILNKNVNKEMTYSIVAPQEADFKANKISSESPIGKALMGKEVGDEVEVDVPAGKLKLEIKKIERKS